MSQSPTPSDLLAAALDYAARGWPVLPCSPQTKAPLLGNDKGADGKSIPRTGGLKKASCDPDVIRGWWRRWPRALVGLATGHGHGDDARLFVVDFDPRTDDATGEIFTLDRLKGELEAQMAEAGGGALPLSRTSMTQSGGVHLWLRWPDDGGEPIRNRGNLPLHVDVRGLGGYIIAPPSVMASGKRYRWLEGRGPETDGSGPPGMAIAEAPAALVAILRAGKGAASSLQKAQGTALRDGPSTGSVPPQGDRGLQEGGRRLSDPGDPVDAARRKWALAVLDRVLGELAGAAQGERGQELNRCGYYLGQMVGAGVLSEAIAVAGLEESCVRNGLAATDGAEAVRANAERAVRDGKGVPVDLSGIGTRAGSGGSRADRGSERDRNGWREFAPYTDGDAPLPPDEDEGGSFQPEDGAPDQDGGAGPPEARDSGGDGFGGGRIDVAADPERDRACALLPQTDLGNAERFFRRYGRDYRFCPDLGWFRWDGRRWRLLSEEKDKLPGEVMQAIYLTVRAIRHEADAVAQSGVRRLPVGHKQRLMLAARLLHDGLIDSVADLDDAVEEGAPDPDTGEMVGAGMDFVVKASASAVTLFSDTLRSHAKASEGAGRLRAIGDLAKNMEGVLVDARAFDVDRDAINVRNGTIRIIRRGNRLEIRRFAHDRRDLITKLAEVDYDPRAESPEYDGFLARVQPDAADRRFLHQWAGLSSTGDITHHKMAFFWGKGRNGKSTWVDIVAGILGDYAMTIGFDTFLEQQSKRKGSDATPDIARLPGVRFLRASEPEKGAKLAEGLIKEVTGGEPITARHLNKGFFEFLPAFKFTAQGNYRPKITGTDDGIWARVRLVPWTVRIPDSEIDRSLPEKLKAERAGIFNRMMAGLIDLRENGLVESENIKEASRKYREASDALGRFLRDCTADETGKRTKSSELLAVFNAWAKASGSAEWQPQGFAKAMEDRGYERITSNGVWWVDIVLTVDVADIEAGRFGSVDDDGGGGGGGGGAGAAGSGPSTDRQRRADIDDDDFVPGF